MSVSESEQEELRAKFRLEVEAEHLTNLKLLEKRSHSKDSIAEKHAREAELAAIKQEVRNDYFISLGYQPYTDSRGHTQLIPPEDFERKQRRRRTRKKRAKYLENIQKNNFFTFAVVIVLAFAVAFKIAG
jgi:hypothetical protein